MSQYPLTKLFVAKFSSKTTRRDIEDLFSKYGDLYGCKVNERESYATVTYKYAKDAEKAISKLNGTEMLGGTLLVEHTLKKSRDNNNNSYRMYDDKYRERGDYRNSRYERDRDYQNNSRREQLPFRFDKEKYIKGGLCFNCSEKGHIARECPDAKQGIYRGRTYNGDRHRKGSYKRSRSRSGDRRGHKRSGSRDSRDKKRKNKYSRKSRSSSYSRSESKRKDKRKQKSGKNKRSSSSSSSRSKSRSKSESRSNSRTVSRSVQKTNNINNDTEKKNENGNEAKSRSGSIDARQ